MLFIDKIEALVPIQQRVISQFFGEVDGLGSTFNDHVLLRIGAAGEPAMIDPAMMRPGRFDTKVYVGSPDAVAREQILRALLNDRPISDDVAVRTLPDITAQKTGAELRNLVQQAADRAFLRAIREGQHTATVLTMSDFNVPNLRA